MGRRCGLYPGLALCRLPQTRDRLVVPSGADRWPMTDGLGPGGVRQSPILVLLYELGLVLCVSAKTAQLCPCMTLWGLGSLYVLGGFY